MSNKDVLGKGIVFPMQVNGHKGIAVTSADDKVRRSMLAILGTAHGERVMRPLFGCNLQALAFAPNTQGTANLAEYYVREGLNRWEPRIELREIVVENDNRNGRLLININYKVRASAEINNLVYPFYLDTN